MEKIRVAIAGVGNCASSLIQGVTYYRDANPADDVPGLMHVMLGDYHVSDIEFVAAFDVDASKVGSDLAKAIEGGQNNTIKSPTFRRWVSPCNVARPWTDSTSTTAPRSRSLLTSPWIRTRPSRLARPSLRLVPSRWLRGCPALLRACALDAGVAFVNPSQCSLPRPRVGPEVHRRQVAHHR